jgi:DNA-binding response OmpR family regulator
VRGASVPIIALTAGALETDREQAMLAGMTDFLTKPLMAKILEVAMRRALRRGPGDSQVSPASGTSSLGTYSVS